jgi:small subunit ribosomal protein S20
VLQGSIQLWPATTPRSKLIVRTSSVANTTASSVPGSGRPAGHPAAIDSNDPKTVTEALRQTVSLVDKMASKGLIHRNTAGRYKSRLAGRVAKRTVAA